MRVTVIGAGLAGLSVAWYLREAGAQVTVLERHAGPGLDCSFANGALLHASMVEPWNSPGVLRQLLQTLGRSDADILIRPGVLPGLLGWGTRFIRESRADRYLANTTKNLLLARYSLGLMAELRRRAKPEYGAYVRGSLQVFRNHRSAEQTLAWLGRLASVGLIYRTLSVTELIAAEPALAPIADVLVGAVHSPQDEGGNAYEYCCAMALRLQQRDVALHYGVECRPLTRGAGAAPDVTDRSGQTWPADAVVLAAGSYSTLLARHLGLVLPVRPVKGYSITAAPVADALIPRIPVIDASLHMAAVPLAAGGLRIAGTAEFAGYNVNVNPKRVANLIRLLRALYPEYARRLGAGDIVAWAGLRPMCPDGVPLLGPTPIRNLFLNTGHGHLGWTLAAGSARLVADAVLGRNPDIDPAAYGLARFSAARA